MSGSRTPRLASLWVVVLLIGLLVWATATAVGAAPAAQAPALAAPSSTPAPASRLEKETARAGSGQVRDGRTVQLPPRSASLPSLSDDQRKKLDAAVQRSYRRTHRVPDDPTARRSSGPPGLRETQPAPRDQLSASAASPTDLVAFRNTALSTGAPQGYRSTVHEPSVAANGNTIFYTANWYAALSTDGGQSFSFVSPFAGFPADYGGFCCDQVALYEPSRDLTIWEMLYIPDSLGNNTLRIAVARGQAGLASNTWSYWDVTAQQAGFSSGTWLDYPHLALGSNYLYLTSNVFDSYDYYVGSVIFRFPLDALATPGGPLPYAYYAVGDSGDTFTPAAGATTTAYWARHLTTTRLRVYAWPEGGSVTFADVPHAAFVDDYMVCMTPDGTNMCGRNDARVKAGWVAGGELGFMWDVAQGTGGLGIFPYPYVHVVRIDRTSMAPIDEPIIWNSAFAWAYPGLGVNGRGHLGLSLAYGGGAAYPSSYVFVRDDLSPTSWQPLKVRTGTNGPGGNNWGDYLTVRAASGNGNTWVGTAYTLQGSCPGPYSSCDNVEPRFVWFGRQRDDPVAGPTPTPSPTPNATPTPTPGVPSNDNFAGASALGVPGSASGSTQWATMEAGELSPSCASISRTVWYRLAPGSNGVLRATTAGSGFDTVLALYSGSSLATLIQLACDDDSGPGLTSSLSLAVTAGQTYYLQLGGYAGAGGSFALQAGLELPPSNDSFASASVLSVPGSASGSTLLATLEAGEPSPACGPIGKTVWYRLVPEATGTLSASTAGSGFDTLLALYSGSSLATLTQLACDDESGGGGTSRLSGAVRAGQTYYLQLGGYYSEAGSFVLNAWLDPPPSNDSFASASTLSVPGTASGGTLGAFTEDGEPTPSCASIGKTVWYRLTPGTSGVLTASTAGSSFDTVLAVYSGASLATLGQLACDDQSGPGDTSRLTLAVTAGQTYSLQLGGYQGDGGSFELSVSLDPPTTNDTFAAASALSVPGSASGTTRLATTEAGEPNPSCGYQVGKTVWYRLVPGASGILAASTLGSDFDTVLAVYSGSSLASLSELACDDESGGSGTSRLTLAVAAGQTYYLQLGGWYGASGSFTLGVSLEATPANDPFAAASALDVPGSASGTSVAATTEAGEASPSCAPIGKTVWYRLVPGTSGTLVASTAGSGFDTVLALYSGTSLASSSELACNDDEALYTPTSRLSVAASAGQTYYLQLGGHYGAGGSFTVQVSLGGTPAPTPTLTPTPTARPTDTPIATATSTPSPTATITVTPSATPVSCATITAGAGVCIQPTAVAVAPSGTVTVALQATLPGGTSLGAWTVDVSYDQPVVSIAACTSSVGSLCNTSFATSTVRVVGSSLTGLTGTQVLASLTFQAVGTRGTSSPLTVTVADFADTAANQVSTLVMHGTVIVAREPTVTFLSPSFGPGRGGTLITISGANFQSGAAATLDGRAATEATFVSGTSLTARTPAHTRALGDVNGSGSVTSLDALCILRAVAALPATTACPDDKLTSAVDVVVTNPDGQSGSLPAGFTYRHADVNGNGSITSVDSLCTLRMVAALPATTNCPSPPASPPPTAISTATPLPTPTLMPPATPLPTPTPVPTATPIPPGPTAAPTATFTPAAPPGTSARGPIADPLGRWVEALAALLGA
ncbi:MAG: IPT/TIG domain-containing protein [Chloroflexi bacterium]|nr:IPT/TIG domain-containing protein [Chloroflexota bacterium]